jgi:exodeoxyribonuclease VII large subunit
LHIYSVGQLTHYLKGLLEGDPFLGDLWVTGEISNLNRSMAGHLYFTLKERDSQLRCVFFSEGGRLDWLGNGAAVVAHGRVSLYEARGDLQLYVDVVQPEGVGALHLQLEELRARLEREGLFEPSRKRPLPPFPRRIGVVTSPVGAALRDILNILSQRYPLAEVVLAPTPVQGDGAVEGIVEALGLLNRVGEVEVIILARGGGSLEELWAFNEEPVVRAVYGSRAPVVCGVGHETDTTLADLAADLRAPTPSAAAMAVTPDRAELAGQVNAMRQALTLTIRGYLDQRAAAVEQAASQLLRALPDLASQRQRVDDLSRGLLAALQGDLRFRSEQVRSRALQLESLSPLQTLRRGYAVVRRARDGLVVASVSQVVSGETIQVQVSDGGFRGRVLGRRTARRRSGAPSLQGTLPLG